MQLQQQREKLAQFEVDVLVVSFEMGELGFNYRLEIDLCWPIVVDRSRELYRYYGMARAGFWDLWGPATWKFYLKELIKGNFPRRAHGDIHQRGGNVLIDPDGMVRLHHIGKGPADRPEVAVILDMVEQQRSKAHLHPPELKN